MGNFKPGTLGHVIKHWHVRDNVKYKKWIVSKAKEYTLEKSKLYRK